MGYNLKMLAEERVDQTLYYDHGCTLELRECIHDHFEDLRPVYTKEEFLAMSDHWIEARRKYDELGQPEPNEQNVGLHHFKLPGKRLHHERTALEFTKGGADKDGGGDTFHFHYRHVRTHLSKRDFAVLTDLWGQGGRAYNRSYAELLDITAPNVFSAVISAELYLPWLEKYECGEFPKANPEDYWDLFLDYKQAVRPGDEQRPDGGWWRDPETKIEIFTRDVPEDLNQKYLFTLYEVIKKYGYGEGPFKYDYMPVRRMFTVSPATSKESDRVQLETGYRMEEKPSEWYLLRGAHRGACLLKLGYTTIPVIVSN